MSRGDRACRTRMLATCPQQVVRVGLVEFAERHDTRTSGQQYTPQQTAGRPIRLARGELNGEVARHARHPRSILARTCRRGCHEHATRQLLPWNIGYTAHFVEDISERSIQNDPPRCETNHSRPQWTALATYAD